MDKIKDITPKVLRGTNLVDMVKFINAFNGDKKISEIKTVGNLLYEGSLRNIGFYDKSDELVGVVSIQIGGITNLIIKEDYDRDVFQQIIFRCAELIFEKLKVREYFIEDVGGEKKIIYWIKTLNQKKVKNFRSLLPEKYYPTEIKTEELDFYLRMLKTKELIRTTEKNVLDLFNIFRLYQRDREIPKFTEKQMILYFLNKNPDVVTYFIRSLNFLSFRKVTKINRLTNKKILIGKIEFFYYNSENIREIRVRFIALINLILKIEKIDQIIFRSNDAEFLFDSNCFPFEETYALRQIPC